MTDVRTSIPPPGPHGGDGAAVAAWLGVPVAEVLDLSASLNPFGPDIAPLLVRHARAAGRYGDPEPLEEQLAELLDAPAGQVVLTNGASEAIALVARVVGRGWVEEPDFSVYRRHLVLDRRAGRWRSNPRSPTGTLAAVADTAAVWDEAYWPLATGTWTRGDHRRGAIVIGSLTKLFATPGLRCGYVLAPDPGTADAIRAERPEWPVGALTLEVVRELVAAVDLSDQAAQLAEGRAALAAALGTRGWSIVAADAPWVLVHDAPNLRADLARRGVVVRDCASFGMPATVRIAVPSPDGLERLCTALDQVGPP